MSQISSLSLESGLVVVFTAGLVAMSGVLRGGVTLGVFTTLPVEETLPVAKSCFFTGCVRVVRVVSVAGVKRPGRQAVF